MVHPAIESYGPPVKLISYELLLWDHLFVHSAIKLYVVKSDLQNTTLVPYCGKMSGPRAKVQITLVLEEVDSLPCWGNHFCSSIQSKVMSEKRSLCYTYHIQYVIKL